MLQTWYNIPVKKLPESGSRSENGYAAPIAKKTAKGKTRKVAINAARTPESGCLYSTKSHPHLSSSKERSGNKKSKRDSKV